MKIIHPNKVTGQLLDIIHDAQQELVIVSPYVNFAYWQRPVAAIKQAINRGVKVDFYMRDDGGHDTGRAHVEKLGITPILVENLHAKIYYNETDGIITSMNLLHSSDSNSIEIGCQVETPAELAELRRIVQQFDVLPFTGPLESRASGVLDVLPFTGPLESRASGVDVLPFTGPLESRASGVLKLDGSSSCHYLIGR